MELTRHLTPRGPRWAVDGRWLPEGLTLGALLSLPRALMLEAIQSAALEEPARGDLLAPVEPGHEVWASGVTYVQSREARRAESEVGDVYARVYEAERPELFLKAIGWRVVGHESPIRIRQDSRWNVPEPELVLVINRQLEVVGYTAGNDVSSRDIEGENPLYLPQAKIYDGACALGPGIHLAVGEKLQDLTIELTIDRQGKTVFSGSTAIQNMRRGFEELVAYLGRSLQFPEGVFLMTGTGIVPPDEFTLLPGDRVTIRVGALRLLNVVAGAAAGREGMAH